MVNDVIVEQRLKLTGKKEFFVRLLSSFMFVPIIAMIFVLPYWAFCLMCFGTYLIMAHEVLSPGVKGYKALRGRGSVGCVTWDVRFHILSKRFWAFGMWIFDLHIQFNRYRRLSCRSNYRRPENVSQDKSEENLGGPNWRNLVGQCWCFS